MVAVTALRGRSGRLVAEEGRADWSEVKRKERVRKQRRECKKVGLLGSMEMGASVLAL